MVSNMLNINYRPDIDGLRAIAVISVLIFHAFPEFLPGGFIGVDIFFVISGFLISKIIFENLSIGEFSFIDFYARRIRRIFPGLLLVLACSWVVAWFTLLPEEFKSLGKHVLGGAGFISNLVLWNESGYFDTAASTKPLLHLWSLGIEEQFYLIWPVLLWVAFRMKISLIGMTLCLLLASFLSNIALVNILPIAVFYAPMTRTWELLAGAILAWMLIPAKNIALGRIQSVAQNLTNRQKNICSGVGLLLLVGGINLINEKSAFPGWWALIPVFGAVLLILSGPQAWLNRHLLSNKIMIFFGLISFPLYLWHWPLLSFARNINPSNSEWMRALLLLISVLLAWLTYRFIERPLRMSTETNVWFTQKFIISFLVFLMAAIGYAGYAAYIRDGIPIQRVLLTSDNPVLNKILIYKFETGAAWRMGNCFLTENQPAEDANSCPSDKNPNKPTLVLWGDSHAAHLYPGVKSVYQNQFNIVQRTASACPPILGLEIAIRPQCKKINDKTLELIKEVKPNLVILAADWQSDPFNDLTKTIASLRDIGIKNIALVGPVPRWENNLPKQLSIYCKQKTPCEVPYYMSMGLIPKIFEIDALMSQFALDQKIYYLSPAKIMCGQNGCLVRQTDAASSITAWDTVHLTDSGSMYLVSHFLLPNLGH